MRILLFVMALLLAGPALAGGDEVVLKTGTLADFDRSGRLIYAQTTELAAAPELANREVGEIILAADPKDDASVTLAFEKDGASRRIGSFPQSVGNPLFMYFAEAVVRDMANFAGGSPFYIRNRVKDALMNRAEFTEDTLTLDGAEIATTIAVMKPFDEDPNRERMHGFEDLTITAIMSDDAEGWYISLDAQAVQDGQVIYRRRLERQP